ncbi:hypothetical protein NC661_07505 [Aquibacillus koreensis]|uniref:Uncharacterized protein n=1 Tax=Aquibacillus koreensis TaxID=279446 RepID=A0A9X3WI89_9BACI|nr:hypothetical protein [Aquibacillus koreensis]MCT2535759.1 hypothetical protein [Aquibacillus koreensis]MDC3420215.1 hypothetical protein [Aquibacillus koreensis]
MADKPFQPKDTGKLTNFHYGTDKDDREEEALTTEGTKDMNQVRNKNKK